MSTLKAREEPGKGLGQIPRAAKKEREEAIIPKEDHAFLLEEWEQKTQNRRRK